MRSRWDNPVRGSTGRHDWVLPAVVPGVYAGVVPAEKLSISFDPETIQRARRAAARSGVPLSTWMDRAARREADLDEARAALDEQFAEHGQPSAEASEWARDALANAGVGQPESADEAAARQNTLARLDALDSNEKR